MALRFTNSEKWDDEWFSDLTKDEKLLYMFLTDKCNIGGFIEINRKIWSAYTGIDANDIDAVLYSFGKKIIMSNDGSCLYVVNFLKHQKNYPLNPENKAHIGILKIFNTYAVKFGIEDITQFIERGMQGGSVGVLSPTGIGIGIGKGIGTDNIPQKKINIFSYNEESVRNFYIEQLQLSGNDAAYKRFIEFIFNDIPNENDKPLAAILSITDQMSWNQYKKLNREKGLLPKDILAAAYRCESSYQVRGRTFAGNVNEAIKTFLKD